MENTIQITKERILELIPKFFQEALEKDYNNPIKEAIEGALKEKEGLVKQMVNEIITESLTTPEFKEQISKQLIAKLLERGLRA